MATTKTISDAQLELAFRLGQTSAPSNASELAKRLSWFNTAINNVLKKKPLWFTKTRIGYQAVANKQAYDLPANYRKMIEVRISDYEYKKIPFEDVYDRVLRTSNPVAMLPEYQERIYWIYDDKMSFVPIPDTTEVPTTLSVSSATYSSSTGYVTLTTSTNHNLTTGSLIDVSGAGQTEYNGQFEIIDSGDTTVLYTPTTAPSVTTATGTITSTRANIELWYYSYPTKPTGNSSLIVLPDEYIDILVSYAEGRYWSTAHKRAKSSDAFVEYETLVDDLMTEDFRRGFGEKTIL